MTAAPKETQQAHEGFTEFLHLLAEGSATQQDWRRHAIAHYSDAALETARMELVKVSLTDSRMPTDSSKVRDAASELIRRLAI
ncbi:hypothetical protein [Lysobacter sp. Root690]|uniref:hypothetical protein n=1 Tax=Lysobacter sp. Root690 TaxID=1736588 RepID=UPI0006F66C0F|nr:hypothetical protein [Lysobacter sp. Root690]KRB07613.1 hypothetical protein ASD86_07195 [Lysobacter sp. Root690]